MAYSYGATTGIWKRPFRHYQPSEPATLCVLEASKAAGSLGWRSLRSYIMLLSSTISSRICIYPADTRNIRGSATMIRLRISLHIYIIYIHHVHVYTKTKSEGRNSKYQLKNIIIQHRRGRGPTHTHKHILIYLLINVAGARNNTA